MSITLCVSVSLFVRERISETVCPNFTKFSVRVTHTCGRRSIFFLRYCNMLCTSGFVDDITFVKVNGV